MVWIEFVPPIRLSESSIDSKYVPTSLRLSLIFLQTDVAQHWEFLHNREGFLWAYRLNEMSGNLSKRQPWLLLESLKNITIFGFVTYVLVEFCDSAGRPSTSTTYESVEKVAETFMIDLPNQKYSWHIDWVMSTLFFGFDRKKHRRKKLLRSH